MAREAGLDVEVRLVANAAVPAEEMVVMGGGGGGGREGEEEGEGESGFVEEERWEDVFGKGACQLGVIVEAAAPLWSRRMGLVLWGVESLLSR
jgi:hypothetical protein